MFFPDKYRLRVSFFSGSGVFVLLVIFGLIAFGSCSIFQQAKAYERFIHCRFAVRDVKVLSVAGIDVSQKENYSDLDFGQIVSLGMQMMQGNLPSVMEITVEGYNSTPEKAAVSGMDWLLQTKTDTLAVGTINREISILPGKSIRFPVKVNFNLARLLKSGSLEQILKVVLGDAGKKEYEKLGLVFKFRPWYQSGKKVKKSPVYFTIYPKFEQLHFFPEH